MDFEAQKKTLESVNNTIENLLKTRDGKVFLLYLLDKTGVFKAYYEESHLPLFEGRRTVGAELMTLIKNQDKNNLSKLFAEE